MIFTRKFTAVALVVAVFSVGAEGAVSTVTEPLLKPCELSLAESPNIVKAECATLNVPENPAQPEGKQIALEVAVLPAKNPGGIADPVFFLAGGPGQSAIDILALQPGVFNGLNKHRDIVFLDQRGTGRSNALRCDSFDLELDAASDPEKVSLLIRQCLADLPGDPRFYTTGVAVQDLDLVRQNLGYKQINLVGGSYGTRIGQEYLRRYPQHTRSLVIDGVVPPDEILGTSHAQNLRRTLDALVENCENDQRCSEAFPEVRANLQHYLALSPEHRREVEYRDPLSGEWRKEDVDRGWMDIAVRMLSYQAQSQALLPLIMQQVAADDWRTLIAQARLVLNQMQGMMALGMHNAVICSEDAPFFPQKEEASGIMDNLLEGMKAVCKDWPAGEVADDFHALMDSDVPALLLSGSLDPVTPPEFAERALVQFRNGRHLVAKGLGHMTFTHHCYSKIIEQFIGDLQLQGEHFECANEDWSQPFFLSPAGPAP